MSWMGKKVLPETAWVSGRGRSDRAVQDISLCQNVGRELYLFSTPFALHHLGLCVALFVLGNWRPV